jgi:hypothetical protein
MSVTPRSLVVGVPPGLRRNINYKYRVGSIISAVKQLIDRGWQPYFGELPCSRLMDLRLATVWNRSVSSSSDECFWCWDLSYRLVMTTGDGAPSYCSQVSQLLLPRTWQQLVTPGGQGGQGHSCVGVHRAGLCHARTSQPTTPSVPEVVRLVVHVS